MYQVKFPCRCHNATSRWTEEPSSSIHSYRVDCASCGRFIKWGTVAELHYRVAASHKTTVVPYADIEEQRPLTVEDFME